MILRGRGISKGAGEGEVLLSEAPVSFLGGVVPATGQLADGASAGRSVKGTVFAFPRGKGSTVGSYVLLEMRRAGTLPAAIINASAEPIVATGAVMSGVPMVDRIDLALLRPGDRCVVDGSAGTVKLPDVRSIEVVSCFLRHGEDLLVLKRSDKVGSFQGHWAAVSGFIEDGETAAVTARKELREELGLEDPELVAAAPALSVREEATVWTIHPFLFRARDREVVLDWEHTEYRWVRPDDLAALRTVPGLERVYRSLLS